MHRKLAEHASHEQLKHYVIDSLAMIKETHKDLYETLEMYLYKEMYGCHFNQWLLDTAVKDMVNEDGTNGPHWSVEQTTSVARQHSIILSRYNEYDWNYVMNMLYSDFFGTVPNETSTYVKMARKFLDDKDAPDGKAFIYYMAMKQKKES